MTGVVRKATFLAVLGLAATMSVAMAGVPDPAHCTIPAYADLGGCNGSAVPDPTVGFSCTIRDIGNLPVVNQLVSIQFGAQVKIYNYAFPGFVSCQCVEGTTDVNGVATFHVPGAGLNSTGQLTNTGLNAATWYAWNCGSTTVLGTSHVSVYDENGGLSTRGVEVTDLSAWGADYNHRNDVGRPFMYRSDFNRAPAGGTLEVVDMSKWGAVKNGGKSAVSCGTLCP
jgi:hypothetical protein